MPMLTRSLVQAYFWLREGMLSQELMTDFFDVWQTRRDGKKRGMLEVIDRDSQ